MPSVDYAPLITPLPREHVTAYRQHAVQIGAIGPNFDALNIVRVVITVGVGLFALLFAGGFLFVGIHLVSVDLEGLGAFRLGAWIFVLAPALIIAGIIWGAIASLRKAFGISRWQRWARLDRFAAVNGMRYSPVVAAGIEPGMVFNQGSSRTNLDLFELGDGWLSSAVRIGNYRYTTGSGDDARTWNWGCLSIQLDRPLPHMLLDATGNDSSFFGRRVSNLPSSVSPDQRLSLEGDFDRYFTLYAPRQYERDALYVFTPDLMALLVDEVGDTRVGGTVGGTGGGSRGRRAAFDVEIVDDRMYVYSSAPFDLADPGVWQRLLGIVTTVGSKTLRQTVRYSDQRGAAGTIAPQGRRLRGRTSWITIFVFLAVFAVLWGQDLLAGLVGFVSGLFGFPR
ncbi:hypothetical protein [Naasia lichenicola]|uniref:DUF3137 domain-containing protein n=1 Tax=Naasia lichenicola TaxID=2565933 RepID=A0A4V6RZ27_9MICO|nr:hypothetical protein [Naasia lichenicola]THG32347.1 hypothetical protein E6C64_04835 [Naasia lichenicola]